MPLTGSDAERQAPVIDLVTQSSSSVDPLTNATLTQSPTDAAELADVQPANLVDTTQNPEDTAELADGQPVAPIDSTATQANSPIETREVTGQSPQAVAPVETTNTVAEPIPGTVTTSAAQLLVEPAPTFQPEVAPESGTPVAQTEVDPGRTTRGGRSYIGIGGNIGLGGDTALGDGSFVVNGKLGLTRFISFRPAAIIGDDTVFLLPLTYDFTIRTEDPFGEPFPVAPFLGAGVAISTDEDDNFGAVITGGIDVPLSSEFVANAAVNVGFLGGTTEAGLLIGVGYTFSGF